MRRALGIAGSLVCGGVATLSGCVGPVDEDAGLAASAVAAPFGPDLGERAARLVELALDEGRAHELLRSLCETAPARLSGSANAARAVDWGLAAMREVGLSNVRTEPVLVPHWERGAPESCEILGEDGVVVGSYRILALGGSIATPPGGIEAEVVRMRGFEELTERSEDLSGRIVFFDAPMPRALANTFAAYGQAVPQRTRGAAEAGRFGGVLALVRSMTTAIDGFPHTGSLAYGDGVERVPGAAISTLDAEDLAQRLENGPVRLRVRMSCRNLPDAEGANVVGEIPGTDLADEIVTVGGHLDSWDVGQGAHDDGSGCIHALEAARLILAAGLRPRRTIRVVFFANEENGLRGALAHAELHASERHHAAIESDRGGFAPLGFTTTARGAGMDALRPVAEALAPFHMGALLPGGGGADIGPLREHGAELFGLVTIAQRYFDYHHSAQDRVENVDPRELALGAAAVAHLAAALAGA
jgi:carboxypeptidase Q